MLRKITASAALAAFAVIAAGCMTQPKNLDLSLAKQSAAGVYQVALVPPAQAPTINQMHSWKVKLATADGMPVHGAKFVVDGGMPQHGHGLPTQPRVTREVEDGIYALDGMKFSMTGWWEVKLDIQGPQGSDKVTFNTVVNAPPVRQ
jgi:YtkA-like